MGLKPGAPLALLVAFMPALAVAQSAGAARSVALVFDNDLIAVRGAGVPPDYDYTHGAMVAISWAGAPRFLRLTLGRESNCRLAEARRAGCIATAITIGQAIYTPRRDSVMPIPGERPYAGWLYASATARRVATGRARSLGVEVGVTGPPSLAEPVQDGVHRLLGNEAQLGWAHQLPTHVGFAVRYDEVRRVDRMSGGTAGAMSFRWAAVAGTEIAALSAGADVTVGLHSDLPWTPREPEVERPSRLYLLAGYRQYAVLRNVFVEGRPGGSGRAELKSHVGQLGAGVGFRGRRVAVEYRHVARGREYTAQPGTHAYGSIALAIHGF